MASQVDGTVPVTGSPTTVSVKNNFAAARDELSCYLRTSKELFDNEQVYSTANDDDST